MRNQATATVELEGGLASLPGDLKRFLLLAGALGPAQSVLFKALLGQVLSLDALGDEAAALQLIEDVRALLMP